MATDAQLSQIETLTVFATNLANFSESITGNSKAFVTLITEKLSELRLIERKATAICQQLTQQKNRLFDDYALIAGSDNHDMRNRISVALHEAEHKERIAKRCLRTIKLNVQVAHGAVMVMIDCTKQFNNATSVNVEKGIAFLQKSKTNLEQYLSNQNKL